MIMSSSFFSRFNDGRRKIDELIASASNFWDNTVTFDPKHLEKKFRAISPIMSVRKSKNNFFECRIKGKIRLKDISTTNPIAVGDEVEFEMESDGKGVISDILPRVNYIIRKSVNLSKQYHIIASNIDISVLVVTLNNPVTSTNFIDRFLVSCQAYDICLLYTSDAADE